MSDNVQQSLGELISRIDTMNAQLTLLAMQNATNNSLHTRVSEQITVVADSIEDDTTIVPDLQQQVQEMKTMLVQMQDALGKRGGVETMPVLTQLKRLQVSQQKLLKVVYTVPTVATTLITTIYAILRRF